jgi:hypothetical protein
MAVSGAFLISLLPSPRDLSTSPIMKTLPPVRSSKCEPVKVHLKCKGLRREELTVLYRDLKKELGERPPFRNPTPPLFDAQRFTIFWSGCPGQ